jgi:hypothetical protein
MAFTSEQKRQWRNRPEVQAKARSYKADWDRTNRAEKAAYQRAYRARRAPVRALNGDGLSDPSHPSVTSTTGHDSAAGQLGLFDATNN